MLAVACTFCFAAAYSQTEKEPAALTETMYLLPKVGMNQQFEAGAARHNAKFHAPGKDNESKLRKVEYGNKAGWYVWTMNGTYASLDKRPTDDAHTKDWEANVGQYVGTYGEIDLWILNKKLSTGIEKFQTQKRYEVWAIYLHPWQEYRFNEARSKIQKAYEKLGNKTMLIFNSAVKRKGGPDVGIVWGYDNFADLEIDSKLIETYEGLYGNGSWRQFLEEWKAAVADIDEEHRVKIGVM